MDNASIHTSKLTREWITRHPRVELCFLPSYAGHRENPIEKVWWRMKQQVTANRLYGDVDTLIAAVRQFFGTFTTPLRFNWPHEKSREDFCIPT